MLILFGTRSYVYQLAMLTLVCGRCGNPAAHALRKRVTKFTLFFIPLFPISTKFSTQCTFCGAQSQVEKAQAESLLAQIGAAAPAPQPQVAGQPAGQGQPAAGQGQDANPQQG
ncbi:zinc-ribbon domain-containing protein [Actinacidiphila yeochonensis]|uniref:zinc-ribbon domain-containing protein n=1 Tax=Actinacidiphila yeochonensis TaxID=89050 RepID=UPI0005680623|nr:zinc-ribbon domain-containing protein [Actinacidiphila yeochonensis]